MQTSEEKSWEIYKSICLSVHACLPETMSRLLHAYVHPLLGADENLGEPWQPVTAIHDKGDGWPLCE
jgi:hypothetical protein